MTNRIDLGADGSLDEVVTEGGQIEQMEKRAWFIELYRADGSSVAVWLRSKAKITAFWEERDASKTRHYVANAPSFARRGARRD